MKLIEAKCPKCKKVITVDGDSDSTKCEFCGEKIDVKEALVELMTASFVDEDNKQPESEKPEIDEKEEIKEIEAEDEEEEYENEEDEEDFDGNDDIEEIDEPKKTTTKKPSSRRGKFDDYLFKAEEHLKNKEYDEARDDYSEALKINEKDTYCKFRINYTKFCQHRLDKNIVMDCYDTLLDLEYFIDEDGNKNDNVILMENEFTAYVYRQAYLIHESIRGKTGTSLENVKKYLNALYAYLYMYEQYISNEVTKSLREKILVYIIKIIDYLTETYYCGTKGKTKFRDTNNLDKLNVKKKKYIAELSKINPSYNQSISKIAGEVHDTANKIINSNKKISDKFVEFYWEHKWFQIVFWVLLAILFWIIKSVLL